MASKKRESQSKNRISMASKKRKRGLPTLPEHLIFNEIFPCLPAKSIHRFRCVSTSCRRLLTYDQKFLSAAGRLAGRRYFLSLSRHYKGLVHYSLNHSGVAREIPQKPNDRCIHTSIVNGIVLTVVLTSFGGEYKYTISNADTDETFELPQLPAIPNSTADDQFRLFFYLCHDPKTDTYQVLRTATVYEGPLATSTWISVITLGAKSWSHQIELENFQQLGADSKSVCIKGSLYLTGFRLDNIEYVLVFNYVHNKELMFECISYPAGLSQSRYAQCHLIALEGDLAIIDIDIGKGFNNCEMKLWKVLDDQWSWTTGIRIDFDPRWEMDYRQARRCCFSTNCEGEIMMGLTGWTTMDGCWIFIYNVEKGEWRRVEIRGMGNHIVADIHLGVDQENLKNPLSLKSVWDRFPQNT